MTRTCYALLPGAVALASLILIKEGESGYFPTEGYGANSEKLVDFFNHRMGVDRATRAAFEIGSLAGWNVPGADPERHRDRFPAGEREATTAEKVTAGSVLGRLGDEDVTTAQASLAAIVQRYGIVPLGLFAEFSRACGLSVEEAKALKVGQRVRVWAPVETTGEDAAGDDFEFTTEPGALAQVTGLNQYGPAQGWAVTVDFIDDRGGYATFDQGDRPPCYPFTLA